jgi:two-component system sensor histidine kinase/response regulator
MKEGRQALDYYRRHADELGSRLLRVQDELNRVRRDARRSRVIALILQRLHALADERSSESISEGDETLEDGLLALLMDSLRVDCAALLRCVEPPSGYQVEHGLGLVSGTVFQFPVPDEGATQETGRTTPRAALEAAGLKDFLWVEAPPAPEVLLLANCRSSPAAHVGLEEDRPVAEAALRAWLGVRERKRLERELDAHRHHLQELVDERSAELRSAHGQLAKTHFAMNSVGIGIEWVDFESGRFIYSNRYDAQMVGYSPEEMLDLHVWDINPTLSPEIYRERRESIRQNGHVKFESIHRSKIGAEFPVEVSVYFQESTADSNTHFIVFVTDISARRAAAQELIRAKAAAEAATRSKSTFLANISHEIRTPMNGVLGTLELLLNSTLQSRQRELATTAYRSAESLLEVINDVLDFSRIEAGHMRIETRDFDLRLLLENTLDMLRVQASAKGLVLASEFDPQLPRGLRGDQGRLRQVLVNLLGNAVKFTGQGQVTLAARVHGASPTLLELEVRDTGPGIGPDQQARIFEAFSQADDSTTRSHSGSGLGLAISRRLVQLMGGDIALRSQLGEGACFICRIPIELVDGFDEPSDDEVSAPQNTRFDARVLLAEDHVVNRMVGRGMLEAFGCKVMVVENGLQAVAALQNGPFDLVLMDCYMPELDGFDAAREIRRREAVVGASATPIVALTADVQKGIAERCREAGMNDYLAKPLKQAILRDALSRWLTTPTADGQAAAASADASGVALLDTAVLDELREVGEGLLEEIVTAYLDQTPKDLQALEEAAAATDPETVRRIAHQMKAGSASLGALSLSAIFRELEQAGGAGDLDAIGARMAEVQGLLPQVIQALTELSESVNSSLRA